MVCCQLSGKLNDILELWLYLFPVNFPFKVFTDHMKNRELILCGPHRMSCIMVFTYPFAKHVYLRNIYMGDRTRPEICCL